MRVRGRRLIMLGSVLAVGLLAGLLVWGISQRDAARNLPKAIAAGDRPQAPGFELRRLNGDGNLSLSSLEGNVVVINFWASWCPPCVEEMPLLESEWRRYRSQGVVFVGVDSEDVSRDGIAFLERFGVTYPNVHDGEGSLKDTYGATGQPETYFLDAQGRIVQHVKGPVNAELLEQGIAAARVS